MSRDMGRGMGKGRVVGGGRAEAMQGREDTVVHSASEERRCL